MTGTPPDRIAINHDNDHAEHVGRTADGRQFFLTTPFEPSGRDREGGEFVALYVFDAAGRLIDARIDDCGPRAAMDHVRRRQIYDQRLRELGEVTFTRIEVAPFTVGHAGRDFGLVPRVPAAPGDVWAVEAQPGNYMAFFEPWDSGEYDT